MVKFYNDYHILEDIVEETHSRLTMKNIEYQPNRVVWNEKLIGNEVIFEKRSSVKDYDIQKYIKYDELMAILKFNEGFMSQFDFQSGIDQYILPERVDRLEDNRFIYRYDPIQDDLVREWEIPEAMSKKDLVLQEEFTKSGAIIIFTVSLANIVKEYGNQGYKTILQDVGSVAHYSWLQSLTYGYEGTVFAGFLQKSLRRFTDIDGYNKSQLFAYAFGHNSTNTANTPSEI